MRRWRTIFGPLGIARCYEQYLLFINLNLHKIEIEEIELFGFGEVLVELYAPTILHKLQHFLAPRCDGLGIPLAVAQEIAVRLVFFQIPFDLIKRKRTPVLGWLTHKDIIS